MKRIIIDSKKINDWNSFHDLFSEIFSFPDYYGRNMDAWIDIMDEILDELTFLDFSDSRHLKKNNPEIINAILEGSSFINYRRVKDNSEPVLIISMFT